MPKTDTEKFNYHVPPELIAQEPATPRDSSRLMVLHRTSGDVEHLGFRDILEFLGQGDALVLNNTKVVPVRLHLDDGRVLLLLRSRTKGWWEALSEKGVFLLHDKFTLGKLSGEVVTEGDTVGREGESILDVQLHNEEVLPEVAAVPLPPYITEYKGDPGRYQTVYAQTQGSSAAPTAGFHFTPELLAIIRAKGVKVVEVTLHVSVDTFLPIAEDTVEDHRIYTEYIQVTKDAAKQLRRANRIICVGTTSVRTLEQMWRWKGKIEACEGYADIYILPGHEFHFEAMITNFHYPRSTNLLLVSAFATPEMINNAYKVAIEYRYRFFSFGDAMLIL